MGVLDWLKSGVGELMIARPDEVKPHVVWKHPDPTIPLKAQLTVESDECCVFFRDGKVVATLGPGRHTLDTANLPFLSNLVDSFTVPRTGLDLTMCVANSTKEATLKPDFS